MYKVITSCPVCNKKMKATRLKCSSCKTVIENEFEFSKFEYLSKEQLKFIEVFIMCRGNIKDVEKELGISYPTVRAKLDEVINSLGYKSNSKIIKTSTSDVIEALEKGEISPQEAIERMKEE
ncbi:DUF2089 domain-containing protein [Clostridium sp.]|uniref:DUF2089 domain-containing protein n=1 Tax=Clostridium sp. TaxID=1506 RepID=UPI0025DEDF40|nr:DUF2089 domain-containing protein [Clostridium sp.]MDY2632120.1 DUF2089 domain-containing protein [Clostridium sp.]